VPAGLTSPTGAAGVERYSTMPSCRTCSRTALPSVRAKRGQQCQQALHLLRAMQLRDIGPDVITHGTAISACEKGQHCQQALHLLRAMQHRDIGAGCNHAQHCHQCVREGMAVPAGLTSLTSDAGVERYSTMPSCRMCSRTVRPSVRARRANNSSRPEDGTSGAAPRHRGRDDPRGWPATTGVARNVRRNH